MSQSSVRPRHGDSGISGKILAAELAVSRASGLGLNGLTAKVLPRYAAALEYPWRTVAVGRL